MFLKYTLKEVEILQNQSKVYQAVRDAAEAYGITYEALVPKVYTEHSRLICPSDIIPANADKEWVTKNKRDFLENIGFAYWQSDEKRNGNYYYTFLMGSSLSVDIFVRWICYVKNEYLISEAKYKRSTTMGNTYFDCLPSNEIYFKEDTSFSTLDVKSPDGVCSTASQYPIYKSLSSIGAANASKYLKFFVSSQAGIAVQKTSGSYTQSSGVVDSDSSRNSSIEYNDTMFTTDFSRNPVEIKVNKDDLVKEIKEKEDYALSIEQNSLYKTGKLSITSILSRLDSAAQLSYNCFSSDVAADRGLSYKFVFDISQNKMAIVDSTEIYMSLLFFANTGVDEVQLFYDATGNNLVLRGNDYEYTTTTGRFSTSEQKEVIPSFAIINSQDPKNLTPTIGVEYLEFYGVEYTFKQKYDIINPQRRGALNLDNDFNSEYPNVTINYENQISVGNGNDSLIDKYVFAEDIMNTYIESYTMLIEEDGKQVRRAKPRSEWLQGSYVYRVEEAYWKYNKDITISELLAYFISKGNKEGYRKLCLKILGVDYWLFYDAIINELLKEKVLFVKSIILDEENFEVDVEYADSASFVSGDIYTRESLVLSLDYFNNLKSFFGEELGTELKVNAEEVITFAVKDRFIPKIKPKSTGNAEEDEAIRLNIDLHCPIFYTGKHTTIGSSLKYDKASITANLSDEATRLSIKTESGDNSTGSRAGLLALFYEWVQSNASQILGGFQPVEIYDGYILPLQNTEYVYHYILPKFQDKDGNIVGIKGITTPKFSQKDIKKVDNETRKVFLDLGLIKDAVNITSEEATEIKKSLFLEMKERLWDVKREGRRLFNVFLREDLTTESRQQIEELWNRRYNNFAKPMLSKQPIFVTHNILFGSKSKPMNFDLRQAQLEGIKHISSRDNSGLLLHEVGFGKTTTSITQINQLFNTGDAKRALFLVPNSVYDKFGEEILGTSTAHGLFPNANVVYLDNARLDAIKKLKVYSEAELQAIENYVGRSKKQKDAFLNKYPRIIGSLSRGRITLPNDSEYKKDSDFSTFYGRLKIELKKSIPLVDKIGNITSQIQILPSIYDEIIKEVDKVKEKTQDVLANVDSTPKEKDEAKIFYAKELKRYSSVLDKNIYEHLLVTGNGLTDELGYYKPEVMQDNTIIIAKHSAVNQLRPSTQAIHKALRFKYGLSMPSESDLITSTSQEDWASKFRNRSQYNVGYNIATTHPVSLGKLNIDAVVIDEIHNYNNIVGNVNSMGIAVQRHGDQSDTTDFYRRRIEYVRFTQYQSNTRRTKDGLPPSSIPTMEYRTKAGNATGYADIRMASSWKAADKNKLNMAAICFDIQSLNKNSKNVLLLSATPFTDHPLQVLSVLGMANYSLLENSGIISSYDFFINYVDEVYKYGIRHDETFGLFVEIDSYFNDKPLSNLITNIANVKITDADIEKTRPVKAVIPQNKIKKDENGVAQTYNMGQYFDELEDVSSKVTMTKEQKEMKAILSKYLEDDSDVRKIYELFPKKEEKAAVTAKQELDDEELKEFLDDAWKRAKADEDEAPFVVIELEAKLFEDEYKDHPDIIKLVKKINTKIIGEETSEEDDDDTAGTEARLSGMRSAKRVAAKALSVQLAQEALVISPYLLNVGFKGVHKSAILPDLDADPAKIFVETSPKLLFAAKSIGKSIAYQKKQLEKGEISKIGGQVVYFNKFNFKYGGKNYNGFELFAEYLVRFIDGISDEKFGDTQEYKDVAIIAGTAVRDDNTTKIVGKGKNKTEVITKRGKTLIRDQFNNGDVKVLLGSKAIKEGIDLQGNAHTMYICQSEFSPTVAMQLEGRIWRQKNPYDNVRIAYVLALNSIDSFIYDKLNKKVNNIKRMLEAGVYEMNTTQFTIDTRERLLELITDVEKLTQLEFSEQKKVVSDLSNRYGVVVSLLNMVEDKYENLMNMIMGYLPTINYMYNEISKYREFEQKDNIRKQIARLRKPDATKEINKFKASLAKEFEKLSDKQKEKYIPKGGKKATLKAYVEANKDKEKAIRDKYVPTQEEIDEAFEESNWQNPLPALDNPIDRNTPYSSLEQVTRSVYKITSDFITRAFETTSRREDYEQASILSMKSKANELLNIYLNSPRAKNNLKDYTDADGNQYKIIIYDETPDPTEFKNRIGQLILGIGSGFRAGDAEASDNASVLAAYQEYVRSDKNNRSISEIKQEYISMQSDAKRKLDNPDDFKEEIRQTWIEVIKNREEKEDFSLPAVVDSFAKSNKLLKLR
jgi:hypothetical protein